MLKYINFSVFPIEADGVVCIAEEVFFYCVYAGDNKKASKQYGCNPAFNDECVTWVSAIVKWSVYRGAS